MADVVHYLFHGIAVCRFTHDAPWHWPEGHRWVRLGESGATCEACKAKLRGERPDKPSSLALFRPEQFPITITITSCKGVVLWSRTIDSPGIDLRSIEIPGYGGTEHVPTKVRIDFADGTSEGA